ncbi:laminin subunit alpha lam-3-like [Centruroides vittatus]|uniref:laminin subunit alpha lam-3-like n=1 Tax=Centruroides vittatus TaxID=120091 RepID=UPI00351045F3
MALQMQLSFLLLCLVSSFAVKSEEDNGGLFPSIFNLATNAIIIANATCGEIGPEVYCKLVEHGILKEPQCGVCDAKLSTKSHPITNAIDGSNNWWQSPTLQNGKQYEWITITLDLRQVYQIAYIILKAGISPRPGNWILERSIDGLHYKPWQYYVIHDADCWDIYGIRPNVGKLKFRTDNDVICTSHYSKINPLENGEIHTSLINGRPSADDPSPSLKEFTTARFVRLRLQKIRTLNADLMLLQNNASYQDKSVTRRYFYSIKDISIGGQCICYGHAKYCPVHHVTKKHQCQCEHNTCGENCEMCCPLYNQQPWKEGTKKNGAECESCQCFGHAERCYYDPTVARKKLSLNTFGKYEGGGVCIKCQHHTIGINCEKCEDGYFRPLGIAHNSSFPCHECFCTGPGVTGVCVKDDSYIMDGLKPGDCLCKKGFAGNKCDHCDVGYTNFPECKPCPCHTAGTIDGNTCEGKCICKKNVEGERCDSCKPGFYNLDVNNPDGCSKCFCSGVTHICESNDWGIEIVRQMEDWIITDLLQKIIYPAIPENGVLKIQTLHLPENIELFWQAPIYYLGKKLYSYGGELRIALKYHIPKNKIYGSFIEGPGVILESRRQRIAYSLKPQPEGETFTLIIPLNDKGWRYFKKSGKLGRKVGRKVFLMILNDLTRLLIRMRFHTDQTEGILVSVEMEVATEYSSNFKKLKSVEKCQCPPNFAGLSCEYCDPGFRRVNNTIFMGKCQQCNCNNHAETCDYFTGKCKNCLHNTTGPICNICEVGFYGNPLFGTPEDCQKCKCPLENRENNFSPTCLTITKLYGKVDYICTACPMGYEGDKCERCGYGFFGNPMIPGSYCQKCDCSGNADITDPNYCNQLTGQCLKCVNNTSGWNCHECAENYFGNALLHNCQPCECNEYGSLSKECDTSLGFCQCKGNYVGRNCARCADGYGNIEAGCLPCSCSKHGSISKYCDPVSGQCPCKPGIFGMKCDICLDGYYGFSNKGCEWCGCNIYGSESHLCDEISGQCICRSHVYGRTCDSCEDEYWNLISEKGCEHCFCNKTGSTSPSCDPIYGNCECKPGIGGQFCDHCLPDYYGFSENGCSECQKCEITGYVCDSITGECLCPPHTTGKSCETCLPLFWGYDAKFGCKPCNCNPSSSHKEECDPLTGKCLCLEGYEGRACDKCHFAYYSFPNCLPCNCDIDGTVPTMCNSDGFCQCDENGQCPCKKNVIGFKCDECKSGTFSLTFNNKEGCLECFCFGRSTECEEAYMVWSQITGLNRKLVLEYGNTQLSLLYGLYVIPGHRGNIRIGVFGNIKQPLYWMLPQEYLGDKILAYNGNLQFRVTSDSNQTTDMFLQAYPLILIQGNHHLVLIHTHFLPPVNGLYTIPLNEKEWQHLRNPQLPVTRATLMVTLQNLQYILIRATDSANIKEARLESLSLDVAVPVKSNLPSPYTAVGIESCKCPLEYSGSSCQNPNVGYYRKHSDNYLYSKNILDLVGWAEPCPCNNRSKICDENTGICMNCTENTDGSYCEICAKGYYGDPFKAPCLPCACPHILNSFSDVCESDDSGYICTNCEIGYTGTHCEICSDGYYGNPFKEGGFCKSCNCNSYGSISQICDKVTGQCHCKEGIFGRDCSICQPHHILTESKCISCDDQCSGSLLTDLDILKEIISKTNVTDFNLIAWKKLYSIIKKYTYNKELNENYMKILDDGYTLLTNYISNFDMETHVDLLYLRMRDIIRIKLPNIIFNALEVRDDAELIFMKLNDLWKEIKSIVNQLENFGIDKSSIDMKIDDILNFGLEVLNELNTNSFMYHREMAEGELRKARKLLQNVKTSIMNTHHFKYVKEKVENVEKYVQNLLFRLNYDVYLPINETYAILSWDKFSDFTYQNNVNMIKDNILYVNKTLEKAELNLKETKNSIIVTNSNFENFFTYTFDLNNYTLLDYQYNILARLNPEYLIKYVLPCQEHALKLQNESQILVGLCNLESAKFALKASTVFKDIVEFIDQAYLSVKNASLIANEAYSKVDPNSKYSLSKKLNDVMEENNNILNDAEFYINYLKELQDNIQNNITTFHKTRKSLNDGIETINDINEQLQQFGKGIENVVKSTIIIQTAVSESIDKTKLKVNNITSKYPEIYDKIKRLEGSTLLGMKNLTFQIDQSQENLEKASRKQHSSETLFKRLRYKHEEVSSKLKALKDNILLARQKASSIRISLTTDKSGICVRSFQPDIEPATTNHILINYSIKDDVRDSLLFFFSQ